MSQLNNALPPPTHRKDFQQIEKFGLRRTDTYGWMKSRDWQSVLKNPQSLDSEIKTAIDKENAYTQAFLSESANLEHNLKNQLLEARKYSDAETGVIAGDYFYFERTSEAGEFLIGRRDINTDDEQVLLDMAQEREKNTAAQLSWGGPKFSPNRALLGWAVDETGSGSFLVKVRDIDSDQIIVNDIRNCHGSIAFDKHGQYLFWVGQDQKGRPNCVWRRHIRDGTDIKCFETQNTSYFIDLKTSQSGDFIFIRRLNGDQCILTSIPITE